MDPALVEPCCGVDFLFIEVDFQWELCGYRLAA